MSSRFEITRKPIDPSLFPPSGVNGGQVVFVGTVRGRDRDRDVVRLEYEAYVPMAEKVFGEIGNEAEKKFGVAACSILHRAGVLEPGEVSVVVAVSAEHRSEAFRACEYIVGELKRRTPIWKKQTYRDGTSEWLNGG
ncbi:MAG: molybdenum cofactor biosynthesis protein MoaE [Pseudomonadota bacterium]